MSNFAMIPMQLTKFQGHFLEQLNRLQDKDLNNEIYIYMNHNLPQNTNLKCNISAEISTNFILALQEWKNCCIVVVVCDLIYSSGMTVNCNKNLRLGDS